MSEFERYKNLFAEQGDFDIPSNYAVGLSYKVKPNIGVAFDIQRINLFANLLDTTVIVDHIDRVAGGCFIWSDIGQHLAPGQSTTPGHDG